MDWMLRDRRVRCGVNPDGAFFGTRAPEVGLDRPFLLATADWRTGRPHAAPVATADRAAPGRRTLAGPGAAVDR